MLDLEINFAEMAEQVKFSFKSRVTTGWWWGLIEFAVVDKTAYVMVAISYAVCWRIDNQGSCLRNTVALTERDAWHGALCLLYTSDAADE